MKKIFVIVASIAVINAAALSTSARLLNNDDINGILTISKTPHEATPQFTQLDGNIFLAIKTDEGIKAADGDIVEFVFDNKRKLVSFHINDSNQELIDTGKANLFVMIHHDLALKLKSNRLKAINLIKDDKVISIPVDSFWIPAKDLKGRAANK